MNCGRTTTFLAIALLTVGLASTAMGQSKGSGSSNTGGSRGTGTTTPSRPSPDRMNRMIMVSGKVIMADGTVPQEPVAIECVCAGRPQARGRQTAGGPVRALGRTDFKGEFIVDVAQTFTEDPSDISGAIGPGSLSVMPGNGQLSPHEIGARLTGCDLQGSLAGFRSSSLRIPVELIDASGAIGTLEVGTIVLQKMSDAQGTTVSATSLSAPKDAKKAFDKGHQAFEQHKLPEAQPELEKAVQLYPQYASAWLDLGWVYTQQNQLEKARNAFQQAHAADDKFVPAYVGLASLALRESKWQEAAEQSARATELGGVDFPAAFYYNFLANYRLGNLEQAEKSARQAETLGAQHAFPQVNLLLGVMLANKRDYADAAEQLRSYLTAAPTAPNADKVRQQLAEVEKLQAAESKAVPPPPAK